MANIVVNDRIYNNIQKLLYEYNITIKELAVASSLSKSEISKIKNGKNSPSFFSAYQITYGFIRLGYDLNLSDIFETDIKNVKFM